MRTAKVDSPTKEKLLDAAQRLMLAKGFVATTVDEICDEASLTKGSFFHYFKSKDHLGQAVLDRFVSTKQQAIQKGPFLKMRDPLQRVYGYLDFLIEMSKSPAAPPSCLLGNFAQELSNTHPKIRTQCATYFAKWAEQFKRDLDEAKKQYAPHTPIDTRSLAEHFIAVLEGALILAKAKQEREPIEEHLQHFKRYVKSQFGR